LQLIRLKKKSLNLTPASQVAPEEPKKPLNQAVVQVSTAQAAIKNVAPAPEALQTAQAPQAPQAPQAETSSSALADRPFDPAEYDDQPSAANGVDHSPEPAEPVQTPYTPLNQPVVQAFTAQAASNLIAVPIREQSVPTSRTEQRISAVMPDAVHNAWVAAVQQMLDAESITALTRELAVQSQCVEQGAQHLTLRVDIPSLKSEAARDKLQAAFALLGRTEALTVEQGPVLDSWAKRNTAKIAARQLAAEDLIMNDPLVLSLQAQWGGKIVPGSIKAL
jgi:DNA polymerase III subunit gamma/tau